jgi:alkyl hydroperoxide reductase subunit D
MSLDALIETLPASARDLKLNFSPLVLTSTELTPQQLWGTVAACALAARSPRLTAEALAAAAEKLSPQALEAARSVAAIMGMNNIWYRFHHLSSNPRYASMPARLRMSALRGHGVEDLDVDLWSLAVSALNGCGKCIDAHEKAVREKGASEELVAAAVRVASVIHALAVVVDCAAAEGARAVSG